MRELSSRCCSTAIKVTFVLFPEGRKLLLAGLANNKGLDNSVRPRNVALHFHLHSSKEPSDTLENCADFDDCIVNTVIKLNDIKCHLS